MQDQTKDVEARNKWLIGSGVLVAGVIVGLLIGWIWLSDSSDVSSKNGTPLLTLATSTLPAIETTYQIIDVPAFVSVDDQRAGSLVFVKHTEVKKPTWIAVREIINGSIGNILGAEMITAPSDDVPVTLLRGTVAGQKYAVFLYQEDGDGQFDYKKDLMIENNKIPVASMFVAQ